MVYVHACIVNRIECNEMIEANIKILNAFCMQNLYLYTMCVCVYRCDGGTYSVHDVTTSILLFYVCLSDLMSLSQPILANILLYYLRIVCMVRQRDQTVPAARMDHETP